MKPRLIVMVREPRPGRVKSRLAREIGTLAAAAWYRRTCAALLHRLADPRWDLCLAVTPDTADPRCRIWPPRLPRQPQGSGDLGQRMLRALRAAPGPVLLTGSDLPDLHRRHIARALRLMRGADLVLGPARDGGFWLIGANHPGRLTPRIFHGVRWSQAGVLQATLANLKGYRVALADQLRDVDTAADLCG